MPSAQACIHRPGRVIVLVTVAVLASAVSAGITQAPVPGPSGPAAEGADPIRPLRGPKHDYSSMYPAYQPMKPGSDLSLLDLFGDPSPARRPTLPEFDIPPHRPGPTPWSPVAEDTPRRTTPATPAPLPTPGTGLLLVGAIALTPGRRRPA